MNKNYKIGFIIFMGIYSIFIAILGIWTSGFTMKQTFGIFLLIYANNLGNIDNLKKWERDNE